MTAKRSFYLSIGLLVSLLLFQNCDQVSSQKHFSKVTENTSSSSSETDNGQPYDGKPYVLMGAGCPDETRIQAKIIVKSATSADLVREKCRDVAPIALDSNDFQIDANDPKKIYFASQTFEQVPATLISPTYAISNLQATSNATTAFYRFDYSGSLKFDRLFLDVDLNSNTGYARSAGFGADYLIENGTLYNYSGSGGAWGWAPRKNVSHQITVSSISLSVARADINNPVSLYYEVETAGPNGSGTNAASGVLSQSLP